MLSVEKFELARHSNPSGAFAVLIKEFRDALKTDPEMAKSFAAFQKRFKGDINTIDDARQLAALKKRGADKLGIKVGALPMEMSAGVALMYDTALEALRSCSERIGPEILSARGINVADRLFDIALLRTGAATITALELALDDDAYADRLRERGKELGWIAMQPWNPGDVCEYCSVTIYDENGVPHTECPSKEACENLGLIIILIILIWLTVKFIQWLW